MCYYTQQNASIEDLKRRFNAELDNEETYLQSDFINGFSHPNIPVILDTSPKLITTDYSWGLIPSWAKDEDFRKNTLNARIESIEEKPSYKDITHKRCLIIASAYYEWHWNDPLGKSKNKYQINSQEDQIFTFAGLYASWTSPITGEIKNTYTMVTTKANKIMDYVHNHKHRMPIMLKKHDESAWLDQSVKMEDFAFPYEGNLIAFQV
ncbi:SOS response-associated peptidase [Flavobacterium sp. HJSW_4]|uniref:SOS response-associated peptidase n=1 Tax=Flavobacterium sp. HJSW_4 TaxID=3344660 RepID=UPI0035F25895